MGKSTISMAIFNSYVSLPEGIVSAHKCFTRGVDAVTTVMMHVGQVGRLKMYTPHHVKRRCHRPRFSMQHRPVMPGLDVQTSAEQTSCRSCDLLLLMELY